MTMQNGTPERINLVIPSEMRDKLQRLAEQAERSLSAEIRYALREYIEGQEVIAVGEAVSSS